MDHFFVLVVFFTFFVNEDLRHKIIFLFCCWRSWWKTKIRRYSLFLIAHSVHQGINPPSQTPPPISCQAPHPPPLKSANCPSPPLFLSNPPPPLYRFWVNSPPPKSQIFQWTCKILKFFIKVTKFLVKISHFEFSVMTEKNMFVYKLFLSLHISDFNLFFF